MRVTPPIAGSSPAAPVPGATPALPASISDIVNTNVNIGGIKTEGVDLSTHYKFPSTSAGDFKAGLDWTFTKQYVLTTPFGAGALSSQELSGTTSLPGAIGGVTVVGGIPKQRATVNLSWNSGDWSATWAMEYIGHMIEDCNGVYAFFGVPRHTAEEPGGRALHQPERVVPVRWQRSRADEPSRRDDLS